MTIDQQVALDEALVPHASRLRIMKSNFRLRSDITSKESTLQLVYDVLRLTPFYKAFMVTTDVSKIYMQDFWATATVHHHFIRFKMDNKKQEILSFLRFLGHNGEIRKLTDVNINKLHQPWRSFAAIINKCLSGKSTGYDSLRDDQMFTTIKLVSRYQNTQQFSFMFPIELTNKDIKNSEAYKEYYAVASGAAPPKTKASVRKTKSSFDTSITPPTAVGTRLSTSAKGKQHAKAYKAKSNDDDQDTDEEGEEFIHPKLSIHDKEETKDEESFDPIAKTPKNSDDEGNDDENLGMNVGSEEGKDAEDDEDELYRDVNINLEGRVVQMADVHTTQEFEDTHVTLTLVNPDGQQQSSSVSSQFVTSMLNPTPDAGIDSLFEKTSQMDVLAPTTMASLTLSAPTLTPLTIPTIYTVPQAPTPPTTAPSTLLQDLPNFGSLFGLDHRLKTLEANFSEFMQTNQFAGAVSSIPEIVQRYMDQRMNEAVKNLDENIQKIIKEQVKEQIKVQVSKILPKIKKTMNEQLEAEVLTRSSNSLKTSYAVAADLLELELKKIPIEKMESNKRRDDDADKDEEPSVGSDRGSKRRREGKEPESTSASKEKTTRTTGKSTQGSKSQQKTASESAPPEEPMQTTYDLVEPSYQEFETCAADDQPIAEASQHPEWESARDVYSKRRIIAVTKLKIVEWHNYMHLDWITVRRDDEKLYKFKEGDFKRLRIQDIEDMLLLLVQEKLINLTVEERFAFNVSLRMFTRRIFIQQRVEDLQLGVESYQKKLNLTKPDTYRFDLKRKEAYIAYSNPRGFIYQNKDKQNRLSGGKVTRKEQQQ
nr:hypothetical protein [Tanacetum cinerariifolium]